MFDPATKTRGLTHSELFAKSDKKIIQEIVNDQVKVIDVQINVAHNAGFSEILYELPVNFNVNNMSKADAQTMIYSEILRIYKDAEPNGKGFDNTTIELGAKPCIRVSWINGMDKSERAQRNEYIKQCARKK